MSSSPHRTGRRSPADAAREKAAALRRDAQAKEGRSRHIKRLGIVAAVIAVIVALVMAVRSNDPTPRSTQRVDDLAAVSGVGEAAPPPWPAPTDVYEPVRAAGLSLGPMGTAEHYHVHLDVMVDGAPVEVPADLGIDPDSGAMSALHTHDTDGVLHVEAAEKGQPFTLGQLFTEWNVRLTETELGALSAGRGKTLAAYVHGERADGDPAMIRLQPHQEIALVFGPKDQEVDIPQNYDFEPGE